MLVAERLRSTTEEARPGGLPVTASFGVSSGAGDQVSYQRLFKTADEALYRAKHAGRNCVVESPAPAQAESAPGREPALASAG
jgi:diguanylate cyclase (GGDEF)-like protein